MAIELAGLNFRGPYETPHDIDEEAGIFVAMGSSADFILDVGESWGLKQELFNHERRDCWEENSDGGLQFAVMYTRHLDRDDRMEIVDELRRRFMPPCGDIQPDGSR